ncbi:hypothetical protein H5410_061054, partial [Solanum commersonii]
MTPIFEVFNVPVQAWHSQTIKDVVGKVNHVNQLASKEDELLTLETTHQMERATLEACIVELQTELATMRVANIAT